MAESPKSAINPSVGTGDDRYKGASDHRAEAGATETLNALAGLGKRLIIFVRYKSGPYYLWNEIVHSRFLRSHTDAVKQPIASVRDVVVDDYDEMRWRLQALAGRKTRWDAASSAWAVPADGLASRRPSGRASDSNWT